MPALPNVTGVKFLSSSCTATPEEVPEVFVRTPAMPDAVPLKSSWISSVAPLEQVSAMANGVLPVVAPLAFIELELTVGNVTLIGVVLTEQAGSRIVTALPNVKLSTFVPESNCQFPSRPAGKVLPLTMGPVLISCNDELILAL